MLPRCLLYVLLVGSPMVVPFFRDGLCFSAHSQQPSALDLLPRLSLDFPRLSLANQANPFHLKRSFPFWPFDGSSGRSTGPIGEAKVTVVDVDKNSPSTLDY